MFIAAVVLDLVSPRGGAIVVADEDEDDDDDVDENSPSQSSFVVEALVVEDVVEFVFKKSILKKYHSFSS